MSVLIPMILIIVVGVSSVLLDYTSPMNTLLRYIIQFFNCQLDFQAQVNISVVFPIASCEMYRFIYVVIQLLSFGMRLYNAGICHIRLRYTSSLHQIVYTLQSFRTFLLGTLHRNCTEYTRDKINKTPSIPFQHDKLERLLLQFKTADRNPQET